ncbi:alcohol dehydrogenase-like [Sitodiplosis mosellana]|uniref:alcohol dehydrogenase-like n=1 Tax=Sitodiplosis mosellana TaxID=263140 RepID=UPI002443C79B|nr:alcohol dehydrogenase-like [Sitodiplosis mosellana]
MRFLFIRGVLWPVFSRHTLIGVNMGPTTTHFPNIHYGSVSRIDTTPFLQLFYISSNIMAFKGKTAIITGGLGGIGYATAECFLRNGISGLAILDIAKCDAKVETLQNNYKTSKIVFLSIDVGDVEWVERVFQEIWTEFGKIDILVNGAGILDEKDAEKCLRVNLLGVINTCQIAVKMMDKQMGGNAGIILNISSMLGVKVKPGLPLYCATKHGVVAFTRTMADGSYFEKYGIKFINICPSKTHTPMIDQLCKTLQVKSLDDLVDDKRPIQSAEDCAKCIIVIILSGENGSTWSISGGKIKRIFCDE